MSWKDSKLVAAAQAAAATAIFCITVYQNAIIPNVTASLTNQIESQAKDIAEVNSIKSELVKVKESLGKLKAANFELMNNDVLGTNTAYPKGFSSPKIGEPVDALYKYHSKKTISEGYSYLSYISEEGAAVDRAVYFYDEDDKDKIITHINFSFNIPVDAAPEYLQEKLIGNLGVPTTFVRPGFYAWCAPPNAKVYKSDNFSYLVMKDIYGPGSWPDKMVKVAGTMNCKK